MSRLLLIVLTAGLFACSAQKSSNTGDARNGLRAINAGESAQDFDQLLSLFKSYYAPYQYKENLLKMNIEATHARLKALATAAKTDEEFAGYVMQFGASLKDGHVQIVISNTSSGVSLYSVPVMITPVEGKAIVADITKELTANTGISLGDEITAIDGKSPFDYLPTILKYRASARPESDQHFVFYALSRPSYMTDLIPTSNSVNLTFKNSDGEIGQATIPWTTRPYDKEAGTLVPRARLDLSVAVANDMNSVVGHRKQMGQVNPVFLNEKTEAKFGFVKVYPSDEARKAFGLADAEKPPIYAALYRYSGKTILLVRQATYYPEDFKPAVYMKAYQALFKQYEPLADVMVLDQTHNPGGSYCGDFYDLFARPGDRQCVQYMHADRKWINDLLVTWKQEDPTMTAEDSRLMSAWAQTIEKAYDDGRSLSDPLPLFTNSAFSRKRLYTWTKPMLVLIDELAGSCGDMFPMLVKANGRAKLFGQNTMGLGGNVEEVGTLNNSRIQVRLTRGLFFPNMLGRTPGPGDYVENNGVSPDLPYTHTVNDYRAGFLNYVKSFSDAAVVQ